ncbi:MAG: response regulator transcription factor [Eggerthellaceae bacterium]|nr:response regulator transcription factor [Eggerthellaceae bacterium]
MVGKPCTPSYQNPLGNGGFVTERIYIVEDDATLSAELARLLALAGFEPIRCERFDHAAADAVAAGPACVVLDLNLPGADGLQVCRDIRAQSDVPVIVLTSSESEFDEVMAMNLGADDYVTKPYRPAVLIARIQAHVRRGSAQPGTAVVEHGGVRLDLGTGAVSFGGRTAQLTRNEQRILQMLMEGAGAVVTRQELMCDLWESDAFVDDNTLTVNVNRLRKALASLGVPEGFLQTRRGAGYLVP